VKAHGGVRSLLRIGGKIDGGDLTYEGEPTVDILFGRHDFVEDEPVIPTLVNLAEATAPSLRSVGIFGRVPRSRHIESKEFFGASGALPAENVWAHD
jgi:hypothetical protein